jgi:hypothetical protein
MADAGHQANSPKRMPVDSMTAGAQTPDPPARRLARGSA